MSDINARPPTLNLHEEGGASDATLTPSQQLVRNVLQAEVLDYTKDNGEPGTISVRRPDALAQFRIVEAAGPETAMNGAYMQMVNPLVYIGALDGMPEALPSNKLQIEGLLMRLGHAGQEALFDWYARTIIKPMIASAEAAKKAEREKALLKN